MSIKKFITTKSLLAGTSLFGLVLTFAPVVTAQDSMNQNPANQNPAIASQNTRSISNGQREKLKGVITRRDVDTFIIRDDKTDAEYVVRLADNTRVTERKSNPFRRARNYGLTSVLRGLNVEVEGRGDAAGQLVADRIRVSDGDVKVARSIDANVRPVESRVGQVEQNAERLSGQLDELAAVSNAARGGAKAAQDTADAAIAGVNATNDRISALDDYVTQETASVNFRTGSTVLSPEARASLDQIAQKYFSAKNFVIEITGYADATGSVERNRALSQRRADAVVRYLAEQHRIPLRRMVTPFGYGESQPIADDTTTDGRAQNRRVEVKVLVNRGLQQAAPVVTTPSSTGAISSASNSSGTM